MSLTDRVPSRGELVAHPSGLVFEVIDADPRRIKRLRVRNARPVTPPAPRVAGLAGRHHVHPRDARRRAVRRCGRHGRTLPGLVPAARPLDAAPVPDDPGRDRLPGLRAGQCPALLRHRHGRADLGGGNGAAPPGRLRDRLVVELRPFPGRRVLDRQLLPDRSAAIRLDGAAGDRRAVGVSRNFSGVGRGARQHVCRQAARSATAGAHPDPGRVVAFRRMAARSPDDRISVEPCGLCVGRVRPDDPIDIALGQLGPEPRHLAAVWAAGADGARRPAGESAKPASRSCCCCCRSTALVRGGSARRRSPIPESCCAWCKAI